MSARTIVRGTAAVLLLPALASAQVTFSSKAGGCFAVSDGKGTVELRWLPPPGAWPAGGWRVSDGSGRVLAARVAAGDEASLAGLPPRDAAQARGLARGLPAFATAGDRDLFFVSVILKALTNPAYARAIGLGRRLEGLPAGAVVFQVAGLDAAGAPAGILLKSAPIDPRVETPLPAPPAGFAGESREEGVALSWIPDARVREAPVVGFRVERGGEGGRFEPASETLILVPAAPDPKAPMFVDRKAPVETALSYRVFAVDAFGRWSAPADANVFHADWQAMRAPSGLSAEAGPGKMTLSWTPNPSPRAAGVVVERAAAPGGPFTTIATGLAATAKTYEDSGVKGGLNYYYRLRSVGPRGDLGSPGLSVGARAANPRPPAAPSAFVGALERTRVRLTWSEPEMPVAGYVLHRKIDDGAWVRLNETVDQRARFDDDFGDDNHGRFAYRVKAVAFDNQESSWSATVEVVVPDRGLPPAPRMLGAEARDGKAIVRFAAGEPADGTAQLLVLRSGDPRSRGVVMGRPLPPTAREYEDAFVRPGEDYYYRVVAVGKNGNISDPSDAAPVAVGTPPIPVPAAPKAKYEGAPFPRVTLTFAAPPREFAVVVERQGQGEKDWLVLPGSTGGTEAVDSAPPKIGRTLYRIVYRAANGATGEPSAPVAVER